MQTLRGFLAHRWTIGACRIGIALVFGLAGLAKIGDPAAFAADIHNFRLVPVPLENLVAITLPWIELLAALALVAGVRSRSAAILTAILMGVFTVAVALAAIRGLDIECGCFGTADATRVGARKLIENTLLTGVALIATQKATGLFRNGS